MKGILGKKIGMTQVFDDDRRCIPVTVVEAGPCKITQIKTQEKDKYEAIQLAFDPVKKKHRVNKAKQGHFDKSGWLAAKYVKEFRLKEKGEYKVGQDLTVELFEAGEKVKITGTSKGKGFAGVMRRHNFGGGPMSHGSMTHRRPGSIGACAYPGKVHKGKRMAGHMGSETVSRKSLIYAVDVEKNLILIKGPVPGSIGSYLIIQG